MTEVADAGASHGDGMFSFSCCRLAPNKEEGGVRSGGFAGDNAGWVSWGSSGDDDVIWQSLGSAGVEEGAVLGDLLPVVGEDAG